MKIGRYDVGVDRSGREPLVTVQIENGVRAAFKYERARSLSDGQLERSAEFMNAVELAVAEYMKRTEEQGHGDRNDVHV